MTTSSSFCCREDRVFKLWVNITITSVIHYIDDAYMTTKARPGNVTPQWMYGIYIRKIRYSHVVMTYSLPSIKCIDILEIRSTDIHSRPNQ
jgi:hypothetical protein